MTRYRDRLLALANRFLQVIRDFFIDAYDVLLLDDPDMLDQVQEPEMRTMKLFYRAATNLSNAGSLVEKFGPPALRVGERALGASIDCPRVRMEAFVEKLRQGVAPRLHALYVTGDHDSRGHLHANDSVILKPFRRAELHAAIIEELARANGLQI